MENEPEEILEEKEMNLKEALRSSPSFYSKHLSEAPNLNAIEELLKTETE